MTTKPKRGGPNRNQGSKPIDPVEQTITVSLRMTKPQRDKLKLLGGAKFVRDCIDRSKPKTA